MAGRGVRGLRLLGRRIAGSGGASDIYHTGLQRAGQAVGEAIPTLNAPALQSFEEARQASNAVTPFHTRMRGRRLLRAPVQGGEGASEAQIVASSTFPGNPRGPMTAADVRNAITQAGGDFDTAMAVRQTQFARGATVDRLQRMIAGMEDLEPHRQARLGRRVLDQIEQTMPDVTRLPEYRRADNAVRRMERMIGTAQGPIRQLRPITLGYTIANLLGAVSRGGLTEAPSTTTTATTTTR